MSSLKIHCHTLIWHTHSVHIYIEPASTGFEKAGYIIYAYLIGSPRYSYQLKHIYLGIHYPVLYCDVLQFNDIPYQNYNKRA